MIYLTPKSGPALGICDYWCHQLEERGRIPINADTMRELVEHARERGERWHYHAFYLIDQLESEAYYTSSQDAVVKQWQKVEDLKADDRPYKPGHASKFAHCTRQVFLTMREFWDEWGVEED